MSPRSWQGCAAQHWPQALAALALWCACVPLALTGRGAGTAPAAPQHGEWPTEWRSQRLQPLALTAVETRFAQRFPGRIGRFALVDDPNGSELVLRDVQRPTRMLHPADDCWRGLGWRLQAAALQRDAHDDALWRCFDATRDGARVRVCERIVDAQGQAFTDTSAWFWAASLGRSIGPWRALTRVQAL